MNGFAVVSQIFHRKAFGIARDFGALRPRITVAVKRNAFDAEPRAALPEFRCAVASAHTGQIRKQFAFRWQVFEQVQCFRAQVDNHRLAGFLAGETDGLARPVNVLALQIGDVALTAAQMPAQLVKHFPFEVFFRRR